MKLLTATAVEVLESITSGEKSALQDQLNSLTAEEVCLCACLYVCVCMSVCVCVCACAHETACDFVRTETVCVCTCNLHLCVCQCEYCLCDRVCCMCMLQCSPMYVIHGVWILCCYLVTHGLHQVVGTYHEDLHILLYVYISTVQ